MKTKLISFFILFLLVFNISAQTSSGCDYRYDFFDVKYDSNNIISLGAGTLNGYKYSGIQCAMPIFGNGETYIMNALIGFGRITGNARINNEVGFYTAGILGLYTNDFLRTAKVNVGISVNTFYKNISLGMNYTNNEKLSIKVGFYIRYINSCNLK